MSDDVDLIPFGTNSAQLLKALAGRYRQLSPQAAAYAALRLPRPEATAVLGRALEQSERGSAARSAILGALGKLGDDGSTVVAAVFPALDESEAVRAARGLALSGGPDTLDRLAQLTSRTAPRVMAALNAARRLIAFRTASGIDLPQESLSPNPPPEGVRQVALRLLISAPGTAPPDAVLAAVPGLVPGVALDAASTRRVDCAGSVLWLIMNEFSADAEAVATALEGRVVVAVLARYDGCGGVTYPQYLVGYDGLSREMLVMAPDGRITHRGPASLEGTRFGFELTASPLSRALSATGSFDLSTGKLELEGTVAVPTAAQASAAISPTCATNM